MIDYHTEVLANLIFRSGSLDSILKLSANIHAKAICPHAIVTVITLLHKICSK